jgi:hypothetical protein
MNSFVTYEVFFWIISAVLALVGGVWRYHMSQYEKVFQRITSFDHIDSDISAIRIDLQWIKQSLSRL